MLIVIILILIFLFWLNSPKKPTGVVLYFANVGTGKTTLLSKFAYEENKRIAKGKSKYKYIMSNATISGTIHIPDLRAFMKKGAVQDTLILIDEGSIVYNNRKMNLTEAEIQWFKLIRHYRCSTIVVSQAYNDIDVTLRRLYTQLYLLNYMPLFTLIRPIKKTVGIDDMTHDIVDKYSFRSPFSWRIFTRPLYFKYFDSWWIPSDVPIHDLSQKEIMEYKQKPKKYNIYKDKEVIDIISRDSIEEEPIINIE